MNETCAEVRERLDDLLDGTIDDRTAGALRRHLSGCSACTAEHDALRDLIDRAGALGAGPEPARDLWPGIRERLGDARTVPSTPARGYRAWAWTATAAALVLAAILVTVDGEREAGVPVAGGDPGEVGAHAAVLAAYDAAERDYLASRDELLHTLESRRDAFDPETVAFVLDHLDRMERSAREIRAALNIEPSDDALRRLWMASYRQRVDLLRTVGGVTAAATVRPEEVS
jgi:anti-sigma factor RsiW